MLHTYGMTCLARVAGECQLRVLVRQRDGALDEVEALAQDDLRALPPSHQSQRQTRTGGSARARITAAAMVRSGWVAVPALWSSPSTASTCRTWTRRVFTGSRRVLGRGSCGCGGE